MSISSVTRWWYLAALVVVIAGALLGTRAWLGRTADVAAVATGRMRQSVVVSGRVLAPAKVDIGATITSRVEAVLVDEGARVRANEVLVRLERAELAASLAQATAAEKAAMNRIVQLEEVAAPQAREQVGQAEANLQVAERDLARQEELAKKGFVGAARVDEARRAAAVARSQVASARTAARASTAAGVDRRLLEDQLAQARATRQTAAAKLDQTLLRAPAPAVVLERSVEPGDVVQPGKRLLSLALDGDVRLTALVDEKNLALLAVGQSAVASADAFPTERFDTTLAEIAPGVDPQRGTVEAKFSVPRPPRFLRADMTVSIEVIVADKREALVIPLAAVRDSQSPEPWVLVVRDRRAERVPVRLGARTVAEAEIVAGLAAGQSVIVSPDVAPGERIRTP